MFASTIDVLVVSPKNPYTPACSLYTLYLAAPATEFHVIVFFAPVTKILLFTDCELDCALSSIRLLPIAVTTYSCAS